MDLLLYKTSYSDLDHSNIHSEDPSDLGIEDSPAAEGDTLASGGSGVSVGVGDSHLPPRTKPPTHNRQAVATVHAARSGVSMRYNLHEELY